MTSRATKSGSKKSLALLNTLQAAITHLPTEEEKRSTVADCSTLIEFFSELQRAVGQMPSSDELSDVRDALDRLAQLYEQQGNSLWLRSVSGNGIRGKANGRRPAATEEDRAAARTLLNRMESLSVEEIHRELRDQKQHPGRELQAMAIELGMRSTHGYNRSALIETIAAKIANARGYRALRGGYGPRRSQATSA